MKITLEPAYILHTRPFNETSIILDVFTNAHGRVSLIAKGARSQRSRFKGLLRPFVPLLLGWSGKSELMTLTGAECCGAPVVLTGTGLLSGMYVNELILRLLPKLDDHPALFSFYQHTLPALINEAGREKALRLFEKKLLEELGYAVSFEREAGEDEVPIISDQEYILMLGQGFVKNNFQDEGYVVFKGEHLLALNQETLETKETLKAAKQLMRLLIAHLLDNKPLKTRDFFRVSS